MERPRRRDHHKPATGPNRKGSLPMNDPSVCGIPDHRERAARDALRVAILREQVRQLNEEATGRIRYDERDDDDAAWTLEILDLDLDPGTHYMMQRAHDRMLNHYRGRVTR